MKKVWPVWEVAVLSWNWAFANADASFAFTANRFFSFSVTVGTNVPQLSLTELTFDVAKGGSGDRGFGVRVDTPTTTDQLVQSSTAITATRPTFENFSIPLSGIASLQNLTARQFVTFEVATYVNSGSLEFDNITVSGVIPEPSSALLTLCGAAGLILRRRRQQ